MDQLMHYRAAVDYLLEFADFERASARRHQAGAFALDRIHSLLRRLDRPQDGRITVHVAGSKGKGSTAAMIEAILRAAGFRTGLFTSPHLHEFTERIRLDGQPLSPEAFAELAQALRPTIEQELAEKPGRLSTFEILTAMGFMAFRDADVDVQVVEVGLGGRLDSTNVFSETAVAAITALSHEHTDILGSSLAKIAAEKAGIITAATQTAVLAPQRSAVAAAAVVKYAADVPVPLIDVARRYHWEGAGLELAQPRRQQWFRLTRSAPRADEAERSLYLTPLLGQHQIENAATAIATVEALQAQGLAVPAGAIHHGLATVDWPARLEVLSRQPWIVIDGAHNEESLERVLESLPTSFDYERLIVVLGVLGDKNLDAMVARITGRAAALVVTRPDHPRARSAESVAAACRGWDGPLIVEPAVDDALKAAVQLAAPSDLICVLGSLFVAAEARARIQRQVGAAPTSASADR